MSFVDIPNKLRMRDQWVNWKWGIDDKGKPTKVPVCPHSGHNASTINPRDWADFNTAVVNVGNPGFDGVGFVFTKSDPFCAFDFDNKDKNEALYYSHVADIEHLQSYTEWSPSGTGWHVIVEATLDGQGRNNRTRGIECYDEGRYFTFTGNVFRALDVMPRQDVATQLYNSLGHVNGAALDRFTGLTTEKFTDEQVLEIANRAANAIKFKTLWAGDWKKYYGDKSQSEADLALINIIAHYSEHREQTIRLFLQSELGKRDKHRKPTAMKRMSDEFAKAMDKKPKTIKLPEPSTGEPWFNAKDVEPWVMALKPENIARMPFEPPRFEQTVYVEQAPADPRARPRMQFAAPTPPMAIPGLVGELVDQCWHSSKHQVAEAAIASALGTMAVLCGRQYRHGTMGLNLYLLLLAPTSTGKSFAYRAIDAWQQAMQASIEGAIGPQYQLRADFLKAMVMNKAGSAQGLQQHMSEGPSTLGAWDEYVGQIREMANSNPPPNVQALKDELLRLMDFGAPGRTYRASKYSQRGGKVTPEDVKCASFSILAAGTPGAFYRDMSSDLLEDGFLPRFTMFEYEGNVPHPNPSVRIGVTQSIIAGITRLFNKAFNFHFAGMAKDIANVADVQPADADAAYVLDCFDDLCLYEADQANQAGLPTAGVWSRAKEHVRQIATLIAIGCNDAMPQITVEHAEIAKALVMPTLTKLVGKVKRGETGAGDHVLENLMLDFIRKCVGNIEYGMKYPMNKPELLAAGFVPISALRNKMRALSPFKSHRLGSTVAFNRTLDDALKYEKLVEGVGHGIRCVGLTGN